VIFAVDDAKTIYPIVLIGYIGGCAMDFSKPEILEVEKTVKDTEVAICELAELELSLVGGGVGDVIF